VSCDAPTAPRRRQEDAFTEEDCVTCSPMPGRAGLPPLDASPFRISAKLRAYITLERRVLTIRGRSAASEHGGYQRVYNEFANRDYERVFTLSASTWCTIGRRALDGLWRDHLPPARNGPGVFRDPRPASGATCPQDRGPPAQEGPEALSQNLWCLAQSRSAPSANLCPSDAAGAPCSNSAISSAGAPLMIFLVL